MVGVGEVVMEEVAGVVQVGVEPTGEAAAGVAVGVVAGVKDKLSNTFSFFSPASHVDTSQIIVVSYIFFKRTSFKMK